jgi:peptidyl-prolyl cis-trans isomerase SurA
MKFVFRQTAIYLAVALIGSAMILPSVWAREGAVAASNDQVAADREVVDRIVVEVNDDIVLLSELEKALAPYEKAIKERGLRPSVAQEMRYRARKDVIDELINRKLTEQKAAELGINVEPSDIDAAIEHLKDSMFYTDEDLRQAIAREGYTMKEYRSQIKDQIQRSQLLSREVKSKTVVTREEVEAYYQAHQEQYEDKVQYHLRNIIMQPDEFAGQAEQAAVLKTMQDIRNQLETGASFEDLARQYSQSSFAEDGGDLGLFELDELSEQLQKSIAGTAPGEFTPVIETGRGFQIFYVQEIVNQSVTPVEKVAEEIRQKLYQEKLNERFESWLTKLREQSHIKIRM